MKKVLFCVFVLFSINVFSQNTVLNTLRILYFEASYNEQKMDSLSLIVGNEINSNNVFFAYQGATQVMKAKYTYNPISQFSYLKKGVSILNQAIFKDSTNFEIHFLRFAVEHHIPSFLGFSTHLQTDKKFLLNNLDKIQLMKITTQFGNYLYDFLKISNRFTINELKRVEAALKKYCLKK